MPIVSGTPPLVNVENSIRGPHLPLNEQTHQGNGVHISDDKPRSSIEDPLDTDHSKSDTNSNDEDGWATPNNSDRDIVADDCDEGEPELDYRNIKGNFPEHSQYAIRVYANIYDPS